MLGVSNSEQVTVVIWRDLVLGVSLIPFYIVRSGNCIAHNLAKSCIVDDEGVSVFALITCVVFFLLVLLLLL